jgi:hypothetical protein
MWFSLACAPGTTGGATDGEATETGPIGSGGAAGTGGGAGGTGGTGGAGGSAGSGGTGGAGGAGGTPGDGLFDLTVTGGFGGGRYAPGEVRHVWAHSDPQTEIASWSGDVDAPDAPDEWNTALTMPERDVALAAAVEPWATVPEARRYELAGGTRDVLVLAVEEPVGLVVFFHGAAYSVDQLRTNAGIAIGHHLQRAGWVVAALESELEAMAGTGGWDSALEDNTDLRNVERLVAALVDDGTVPDGGPVVAWGKSSGAIFAHTVGAAGVADRVVAFCAAGTDEAMAITEAHIGWYLTANDKTIPTAIADAMAAQPVLEARGLDTDLYVHPTTPLYDQRFERVAGIDAALSADLAARIRDGGFVDADDQWLVAGTAVSIDLDDLTGVQRTAVLAEIEMMAADHELYDDVAARVVEFLDP